MTIEAASISSVTPIVYANTSSWSKEQATAEAVNQLMIQKFTEIVSSYQQRKNSKLLEALATGPWYPNEYATALQNHKQGKRFEFLKNKHSFYHGFPPKGFIQQRLDTSPTGIEISSYRISADCLPTQALEHIKTGQFSFIDCGSAIELAIYETLREVLGDEQFNTLFSGKGSTPLTLHPNILQTPLFSLGFITEHKLEEQQMSPYLGDHIYFANTPYYRVKHMQGEAAGYHTICISSIEATNKKYIAFGMPAEGNTESEIADFLIDEFSRPSIDSSPFFTQGLIDYFERQKQVQETDIFQTTGIKVSNMTINRNAFQKAFEQRTAGVGMAPVCRRFNIEAIHTQLGQPQA